MSAETCGCGRPTLTFPGEIEPTCGECRYLPDRCQCRSLEVVRNIRDTDGDPEIELQLIAQRYTPVDWAEAWQQKPESVDWLVRPFIEAGTVNALYATPGTGKSLMALEWALRLARAGRTVVYVDEENRLAEDIVDRLQAMGATPGELEHLVMYSFAALPPLDTHQGGMHLLALAVTHGAELVVIDTASRMIAGGENDSDTWLKLYACSVKPLKARRIAVLRIDHPGKDAERGQRGSSAKNGDVDTVWRLSQIEQGRPFYRMHREKSRSGHGDGDVIQIERKYVPLRHVWEEKTVRTVTPQITPLGQLCGQLQKLAVPPSAGRTACRSALTGAGIAASNDLLSEVVKHRKFGCNCPGQVAGQLGQTDSAVVQPPTVRASPARSKGDGGQVSGDRPPDTLGEWPEDSIGKEAS